MITFVKQTKKRSMKEERIKVQDKIFDTELGGTLDGSYAYVLDKLNRIIGEAKVIAKNSGMEYNDYILETYRDSWSDDGDGDELIIYGERLETDEEFSARIKREEDSRQAIEKSNIQKARQQRLFEIRELERLKAKYEQ